jgi:ABC-type glycerol-3-phosphate transport system permease component
VLFTWNDIIWPMITFLDPDKLPIAVGMLAFQGRYQTEYGPLFAGYVVGSLPLVVLFVISIRKFIEGLQSGLKI